MKETLSQYVKRVMQQKALGVRDIERNSKKKITNSHISKVLAGTAQNLTSDKIVALAAGLGVNPHEVFSVVSGCSPDSEPPDLMVFADVIQKLAMNPLLLEVLQELLRFEEKDYVDMLKALRFMRGRNQKVQKRKKKKD
jgi:transcriptional regulator with XRE-family HTH domain